MIKNKIIKAAYDDLLENYSEAEASKILLNSLSILGAKKVIIQEHLDDNSYKLINKYKYPERLASFMRTTNEKSFQWGDLSFAKLALS
jgi:hypothetical protein